MLSVTFCLHVVVADRISWLQLSVNLLFQRDFAASPHHKKSKQVYLPGQEEDVKKVNDKLKECYATYGEQKCLQYVFNADYFWS